jgi:hypothetical protein
VNKTINTTAPVVVGAGAGMTAPITATVSDFLRLSGMGRNQFYNLCAEGEIETVPIGRRRFVLMASYYDFLQRQRLIADQPIQTGGNIRGKVREPVTA